MKKGALIIFLLLIAITSSLSFLVTAGIVYLICFCFGLAFSWRIALGIWAIMLLINVSLDIHKKKDKEM